MGKGFTDAEQTSSVLFGLLGFRGRGWLKVGGRAGGSEMAAGDGARGSTTKGKGKRVSITEERTEEKRLEEVKEDGVG